MPALRERRDQRIAEGRLPAGTRLVAVEGIRGWLYPLVSERGDRYELFAWFDGSAYQVRVVVPDVFGRNDHHASHVLRDGRLCLGPDGEGLPSLEEAYEQSVAWANGFSVYRSTGRFPY